MNIKHYSNGSVSYSYSLNSKKWEFVIPAINFTFLCKVKGRGEGAGRIANILAGSMKRCNGVDNLARANISKFVVL